MYKIKTGDFEVPASHRLKGHEGDCSAIHGHNYMISLELLSDTLDSIGRVVDFSVIKKYVGEWLKDNWDHCCLVSQDDEEAKKISEQFPGFFRKLYLFPKNPTAEIMAREIFLVTRGLLEKHNIPASVSKAVVYETSKCSAEYTPEGDLMELEKEID